MPISLTTLDLSYNQLTSLPDSIGMLTSLTILYLSNNQLTSLSESIRKLTSLTTLDLSYNQLTSLADSIEMLTSLTDLDLSNNQLTSLPESIGMLTSLTNLYLYNNQLRYINNLPKSIKYIDYANNSFILESSMKINITLYEIVVCNLRKKSIEELEQIFTIDNSYLLKQVFQKDIIICPLCGKYFNRLFANYKKYDKYDICYQVCYNGC